MKKILVGILVICFVFSLFSVMPRGVKGLADSVNANSTSNLQALPSGNATSTPISPPFIGNSTKLLQSEPGLPPNKVATKHLSGLVSTPVNRRQTDGQYAMSATLLSGQNHWWLIDYWASSQNQLPPRMTGTFRAVTNTIGNLASGDDVLYLPLNVAYGTSTSNCVWYQFDIDFGYNGAVSWYIWDIQNGQNFHSQSIGLTYTSGDIYNFNLTTSGSSTVTFTIQDTTTGSHWSTSTWTYTPPSLNMIYDTSIFSPASATEGYTTNGQLTNVPYFQTYVGDSLPTTWHGSSGSVPSGISTKTSGGSGNYYWIMETVGSYYVSSINSYGNYGNGYVSNPSGLVGSSTDGSDVYYYGGNYGDGGYVIGNMNTVAGGRVGVFAYSTSGYTSPLYIYVSWDGNTWYQVGNVVSVSSGGQSLYVAGTVNMEFRYIAVCGYDGNYYSVSLYVDSAVAG